MRVVILNQKNRSLFTHLVMWHAFMFLVVGVCFTFAGILIFGTYARQVPVKPDFGNMKSSVSTSTSIAAADGTLLAEIAGQRREWTPFEEIPPLVRNAFISIEDARFFTHGALDLIGLARATWTNLRSGSIRQGGSTITQQVAKYFLGEERTFDRKFREVIWALRLERSMGKEQILELYLNLIFLGKNAYGVKAAARNYFDKNLDQLTLAEAALLAGMAQAPSRYSPSVNPGLALFRREQVLQAMHRNGFISGSELDLAQAAPVELAQRKDYFNARTPYFTETVRQLLLQRVGADAFARGGYQVETTVRPFVQIMARKNVEELTRWQDHRQGWRGAEARLKTEPERKEFLEKAMAYYKDIPLVPDRDYLALVTQVTREKATVVVGPHPAGTILLDDMIWAYPAHPTEGVTDKTIGSVTEALAAGDVVWVRPMPGAPGRYRLEQIPRVQSALHVIDHRSGYVIAMIGGTDFDLTKFNRAVQACRQPGSTYKPFYYSLALAEGWTFDRPLTDIPYAIVDPATGQKWRITNFNYGETMSPELQAKVANYKVTLEHALVWSRNTPSVTIFQAMGARKVAAWVRRFGFTTPVIPDKGLALGSSCTRMDELNAAFAVFARNGREIKPVMIRRIRDAAGNILEDATTPSDPLLTAGERIDRMIGLLGRRERQVIPARAAYQTSILLRKVVTDGHNETVRDIGFPAAGKTGTASDTMDTWFSGYTSRWATLTWLGDEKYERPLGDRDAAFVTTSPLWGRFMYDAARFAPQREIPWADERHRDLGRPVATNPARGIKHEYVPPKEKPPALGE
ncbi:transglycosylase domain-containing protein [Myxococcota bacterium]|nr:transglycosylase domain-containing protein [Myxococcota bacterium]MBU1413153.1 transglycosylase domain-containing protein [Myxococcota bacterium]MBU1511158.1 transglycosylase domain-containing protein [Myxococcota bacterium]